ncbi:hypothetical protein M0R45_033076 [Rubus argutus]|uniref:Late embryogenesis abundant protein LEA-2 subgroup domain-containing protein n=1 Tax=Rubus argutus TaxID=59490 RepID=A0AAW1WMY3_RUBAR
MYRGPSQSSYTMVNDQQFPAPHGRNVPRYPSTAAHRSGGNRCAKCYCFCYCCVFILLLLLAAGAAAAFVIINPNLPKYTITELTSNAFNFTKDFKLHARFVVKVKADNPNKYIGIVYGKDSSVDLLFRDGRSNFVKLCSGKIPDFTQPSNNVTTMKIDLKGDLTKGDFSSSASVFMDKVNSNKIPLVVAVKAPVSLVFAGKEIKHKVQIGANCSMDVNTLTPGKGLKMSDMIYDSATINFYPK